MACARGGKRKEKKRGGTEGWGGFSLVEKTRGTLGRTLFGVVCGVTSLEGIYLKFYSTKVIEEATEEREPLGVVR